MSSITKLYELVKMLYPNGRAFAMRFNGVLDRLHRTLAKSLGRAYDDALSIKYAILPDNEYFSEDDATDWERRLGINRRNGVPIEKRKAAILRKISRSGNNKARQHYTYIEQQLRAAGFDCYVYENRFPDGSGGYITKTPQEIIGVTAAGAAVHKSTVRHGMRRHGSLYANKVANAIEENIDFNFAIADYNYTFFVAGPTVSTFTEIPENRKEEFRQLILTLKPQHSVALLFVNYSNS